MNLQYPAYRRTDLHQSLYQGISRGAVQPPRHGLGFKVDGEGAVLVWLLGNAVHEQRSYWGTHYSQRTNPEIVTPKVVFFYTGRRNNPPKSSEMFATSLSRGQG